MLILLTPEKSSDAEKEQLTLLFEEGLPLLHVRKPGITKEELKLWLKRFKEEHLRKMILHEHHSLTTLFPVKGIHLKEGFRKDQADLPQYLEDFRSKGFTLSSSFHDRETVKKEASMFNYVFLSPVFTSVSKDGYKGQAFNAKALPKKVIALGGIEPETISKTKEMGYAGIAVLGAVWRSKDSLRAFKGIYNEYRTVYR